MNNLKSHSRHSPRQAYLTQNYNQPSDEQLETPNSFHKGYLNKKESNLLANRLSKEKIRDSSESNTQNPKNSSNMISFMENQQISQERILNYDLNLDQAPNEIGTQIHAKSIEESSKKQNLSEIKETDLNQEKVSEMQTISIINNAA